MHARPIRFTRFGTFYVLFAIGVGAAAINTGNNLLYLILGILLGFIIISGFLSDSTHWGITSTWNPAGSFYAGQQASFDVLFHKGRFPGIAIRVESRWKGLPSQSVFVPWIPSRGTTTARVSLTPTKRGYLFLESCHYSTHFPFGLFRKSHTDAREDRWLVYPHLDPLSLNRLVHMGTKEAHASTSRIGTGTLPLILRDYREGDALRQVHWKMSAKRQRLIVKEMEEDAGSGDLYVLEAWPVQRSREDMERLISFIASLAFELYRQSKPAGLSTPDRQFLPDHSRAHLHRILDYLALVDPYHQPGPGTRRVAIENNLRQIDLLSLWISYGSGR